MRQRDMAQAQKEYGNAQKEQSDQLSKLSQQFNGLKDPMGSVNNALADIKIQGSAATTIIGTLGAALGRIPIIGPQIEQMANAFTMLESKLQSLNQFVATFSPFDAKLLDRAFADLNASFGEQLVPVIQKGTQVVRWFGDTLAGLTPVIRPLVEDGLARLQPLFQIIGDAARKSIEAITPLAPVLSHAMESLSDPRVVNIVKLLGENMVELARQGTNLAIGLSELNKVAGTTELGILALTVSLQNLNFWLRNLEYFSPIAGIGGDAKGPEQSLRGDSFGKAVAPTSTTSPQALLQRMQEQAFSIGQSSIPKQQLTQQEKTNGLLTNIVEWLKGLKINVPSLKVGSESTGRGIMDAASVVNPFAAGIRVVDRLRRG